MEATVSEIMSQLKLLLDGVALICQNVDGLKHASSFQPNNFEEPVDTGTTDENADDSVLPPNQLLTSSNSNLVTQNTSPASSQSSSWAEEMDNWDPLLHDDDPEAGTRPINIIPVTERTNTFLTEAFTHKMEPVLRDASCVATIHSIQERADKSPLSRCYDSFGALE